MTVPAIERTCFRCDAEVRTASPDVRVYGPECQHRWGLPAPRVARRRVGAGLAPRRRATLTARCVYKVCGRTVASAERLHSESRGAQLALFATHRDRRRRGWSDAG